MSQNSQNQNFNKLDFTHTSFLKGEYESCVFRNCNFEEANLSEFKFLDCEFQECNFSLALCTERYCERWNSLAVKCSDCNLRLVTILDFRFLSKIAKWIIRLFSKWISKKLFLKIANCVKSIFQNPIWLKLFLINVILLNLFL